MTTKYKCGHKSDFIVMDSSPMAMSEYFIWKDNEGYDGDKSMCWECYCKQKSPIKEKN